MPTADHAPRRAHPHPRALRDCAEVSSRLRLYISEPLVPTNGSGLRWIGHVVSCHRPLNVVLSGCSCFGFESIGGLGQVRSPIQMREVCVGSV